MDHKEYFLFGEAPSKAYYMYDWDEFIKKFKEYHKDTWDFQLYAFDWSMETGEDLLANYDGWNGFAVLDEDEYKQLNKIRDGERG